MAEGYLAIYTEYVQDEATAGVLLQTTFLEKKEKEKK